MAGLSLRLGLGLQAGGQVAAAVLQPAGPPRGVTLSNSSVDDGAAIGTLVGTLLMVGGTEPGTFTLLTNPSGLWAIDGVQLEVAASLAALGGTVENPMVRVTDALGQVFDVILPITIVETATGNDSGIGEGDGVIVVPDPTDPANDGGGFEITPIQQDTSDGLRIAGRNGGSATFLKDLGAPVAGNTYVMKYSADWSGMSKLGRQAAIGFAFKSGNNFHLVALRGNNGQPTTAMLASRVYGDFRKSNQFTVTNDGAAANGTKDGPNWLQIEIAADGSTYTLSSSADGLVWDAEYTDTVPVPLVSADAALQFGPGGYFTNQDKGVFSITIETFTGLAAVPAQFGTGDWSVADAGTSGDITITVTTLPDDGGSALTDLEYQIDAGAWVSLAAATTGAYPVAGLTDDVEVTVALRAVNAIGSGTASATKAVTPTLADPYFANVVLLVGFDGSDGATTATDDSNSAKALTFAGNAQIDTAQSMFGGGSLLLDGSGDWVTLLDHADWVFDAEFTIEFFMRIPAGIGATTYTPLSQYGGPGSRSWFVRLVKAASSRTIAFAFSTDGTNLTHNIASADIDNVLLDDTWVHIAVDRDSANKIRFYAAGSMVASKVAATGTGFNAALNLSIGKESATSNPFNGWLEEIRITKGASRYGSDAGFTPPTAAFPRN